MKQLRLETLTLQELTWRNNIFTGDILVRWLGELFRLRFLSKEWKTGDEVSWPVEIGGHPGIWNFWIAPRLLHTHLKAALGEDVIGDLTSLPREIQHAVLEVVGEEMLDHAGSALGLEIRRRENADPEEHLSSGLDIAMIHEETGRLEGRGRLFIDPPVLPMLAERLGTLPRDRGDWLRTLPVPVSVVIGTTTLTVRELRDLEAGDIVLMDRETGGSRLLLHVSPDQELWAEQQEDGKIVVLGRRDYEMTDEVKDQQNGEAMVTTEDLEVELRFEVGRKVITVGELEKVGVGYVFNLEKPVERAVLLYANRQCIGVGELVDIEGRLGVRIVEIGNASSR